MADTPAQIALTHPTPPRPAAALRLRGSRQPPRSTWPLPTAPASRPLPPLRRRIAQWAGPASRPARNMSRGGGGRGTVQFPTAPVKGHGGAQSGDTGGSRGAGWGEPWGIAWGGPGAVGDGGGGAWEQGWGCSHRPCVGSRVGQEGWPELGGGGDGHAQVGHGGVKGVVGHPALTPRGGRSHPPSTLRPSSLPPPHSGTATRPRGQPSGFIHRSEDVQSSRASPRRWAPRRGLAPARRSQGLAQKRGRGIWGGGAKAGSCGHPRSRIHPPQGLCQRPTGGGDGRCPAVLPVLASPWSVRYINIEAVCIHPMYICTSGWPLAGSALGRPAPSCRAPHLCQESP